MEANTATAAASCVPCVGRRRREARRGPGNPDIVSCVVAANERASNVRAGSWAAGGGK
jgi:hypothetical protein